MSEPPRNPPLELVSGAAPPSETPFDALMRAAETDPEAAHGLALAYAGMSAEERRRLVETVVGDARGGGRSPAGPLALLLAVEEDRDVAAEIAMALLEADDAAIGRGGKDTAWSWGDDGNGGVAVVRHLHGGFVEVLRVAWAGQRIEVDSDPLARSEALDDVARRAGVPDGVDRVPLERAVFRLAEALWRERLRAGALPERLRAFADLF